MSQIFARSRKALAVLATAASLSVALAPVSAQAGDGHRHHRNHGIAAAAIGGGLLLGALIASSRERQEVREDVYERRCWNERRKSVDYYGDVHIEKVKVCR